MRRATGACVGGRRAWAGRRVAPAPASLHVLELRCAAAADLSTPHPAAPPPPPPLHQVYFGSWPDVAEEGPRRYGPQAAGWVRVRDGWTLRDALARPDHTMPGVPTFFVVANGTDFRERFLEGDIPLL